MGIEEFIRLQKRVKAVAEKHSKEDILYLSDLFEQHGKDDIMELLHLFEEYKKEDILKLLDSLYGKARTMWQKNQPEPVFCY